MLSEGTIKVEGTLKAAEFLVSSLVGVRQAVGTVALAVDLLKHTAEYLPSTLKWL